MEHGDPTGNPEPIPHEIPRCTPDPTNNSAPFRAVRRRLLIPLTGVVVGWLAISYFLLPDWWKDHEAGHPALLDAPRVTVTAAQIPGDPLNLFVIASERQLVAAMLAAGWHPADPITLRTSVRIVESSVFHRPYADAPVSNLFLFGRKEDLAFEKPVGDDPRQRHHVRFWQAAEKDEKDRPAWWGAVTYDHSVGFSHTTGQITHHIAPDIDKERDGLMSNLSHTGKVLDSQWRPGFQQREGRNGGGDPWRTDGRLGIVELHE